MIYVLLMMIFMHILDDFHFQGCLANLKQKDWWKKNYPQKLYENDYKISLVMHCFSWSFLTMLPLILFCNVGFLFIIMFAVNIFVHYILDDLKANQKMISLTTDQLCHLLQIFLTWLVIIV